DIGSIRARVEAEPRVHRETFAKLALRTARISAVLHDAADIHQRLRRCRIVAMYERAAHLQSFFETRARLVELALVKQHVTDLVERRRALGMGRPVRLDEPAERLLEQRLRFAREAQPPVDLPDGAQQSRARFGMPGELRLDASSAPVQKLARGNDAPSCL